MYNFLEELEISKKDIKNIMDFNKELVDYEEYEQNVNLLKAIGCDIKEIKNIIISNPNVLIRSNNDLLNLISCFKHYGFTSLNLLFDSNPYLLNKDDFELKEYIEEKKKEGKDISDIIDELESNPLDFI